MGIRSGREAASGLHAHETRAQMVLPPLEAVGQVLAGARVALGELTYQRSDRAASACLAVLLQGDERAEPTVDADPRVEVIKQPVLRQQDRVRDGVDDSVHEIGAVVEVVIELAAAGVSALADV